MINRDSWGHSYLIVRGEILGFTVVMVRCFVICVLMSSYF